MAILTWLSKHSSLPQLKHEDSLFTTPSGPLSATSRANLGRLHIWLGHSRGLATLNFQQMAGLLDTMEARLVFYT